MTDRPERDYVLGTHDEEIARLGLQHRVWRKFALECWEKAGITAGSRILDLGAGPGYATLDLADMVGSLGRVVAIERSSRFLEHARSLCRLHGLGNVEFLETDLMAEPPELSGMDATWCRWVASFVSSPQKLVEIIKRSLMVGGVAMFQEYVDYRSWRLAPRRPAFESFVGEVMSSWRDAGGEPDVALSLPGILEREGFRIRALTPRLFTVRPHEYPWKWPAAFVESGAQRLLDLGRVDRSWVESVRREFRDAESDPSSVMVTPLVLEIVAERL